MELSNGLVFSVEGSSSLTEFAGPTYQPWAAAVEMAIGNTGCSSLDGINNWLLNTVVGRESSDRIRPTGRSRSIISTDYIYVGINLSQTTVGINPSL